MHRLKVARAPHGTPPRYAVYAPLPMPAEGAPRLVLSGARWAPQPYCDTNFTSWRKRPMYGHSSSIIGLPNLIPLLLILVVFVCLASFLEEFFSETQRA